MSQASHSILLARNPSPPKASPGRTHTLGGGILWGLPSFSLWARARKVFARLSARNRKLARLAPLPTTKIPIFLSRCAPSYGLQAHCSFAMIASALKSVVKAGATTRILEWFVYRPLFFVRRRTGAPVFYLQPDRDSALFGLFSCVGQILSNLGRLTQRSGNPTRVRQTGDRSKAGHRFYSFLGANAGIGHVILVACLLRSRLFESEASVREIVVAARAAIYESSRTVNGCRQPRPEGTHESCMASRSDGSELNYVHGHSRDLEPAMANHSAWLFHGAKTLAHTRRQKST